MVLFHVLTISIASSVLLLMPKFSLQQTCSSSKDLNQTECVLITQPSYDSHQWAACVTEDYMIRASNGTYNCSYADTDTQCWYPCMLEIYGVENGSVNDDCSCTPGEMLPTNRSRLPAECYNPQGDDCGWYANCLEMRYPCRGTDDDYAIEYAEEICNRFFSEDNYNGFSSTGKLWINEVRKCLQIELVPSLRLWANYTCADIRRIAFASHASCYVDISPSMCELSCADVIRAFAIVNLPGGDFREGAAATAPLETIDQMLSILLKCYENELSGCIKGVLTTVEIAVKVGRSNHNLHTAATALMLARYFARALYWEENGFGWFPFFNNRRKRQIADEEINVRVVLVDMKLLNISSGTVPQSTSGQTLDQAVDDLVTAVSSGSLSMIPLNIDNTQVMSNLTVVSQCMDVNCDSTTMVTTPPNNSGAGCTQWGLHVYITWLLSMLCLMFLY